MTGQVLEERLYRPLCFAGPVIDGHRPALIPQRSQDFFHAPDNAVFQHDFDAVWVSRRFGKYSLNDTFRQFSSPLVLFLDHAHFHSWTNLGASLTIHDLLLTYAILRDYGG